MPEAGGTERDRAVAILMQMADEYDATAKKATVPDLGFLAGEIADALRRAAARVKTDVTIKDPAEGVEKLRAWIESRPTKRDFGKYVQGDVGDVGENRGG